MSDMRLAISEYARDPENAEKNFFLATLYEAQGQYAAAVSFYLRAAERTADDDLAYESLLKVGLCYDRHDNRHNTVRGVYKHAITFRPDRPEAYYLLAKFDNYYQNFADGYMISCLALTYANFNLPSLRDRMGYSGKHCILFEKGLAAWWWGKGAESRSIFNDIAANYYDQLDQYMLNALQQNIARIGAGPESQAIRLYNKSKHDSLRFKFKGSENIERNYSQVYQDMFVLSMLDGKRNGTYLEVGSAEPFHNNNTALLEAEYGWRGIGIEINSVCIPAHVQHRKNKVLCQDALQTNYKTVLSEIAVDGVVDYLQLDCEPAKATFEVLLSIPFDEYKFAVITYEHDHYVDIAKTYRNKSRNYLKMHGYVLVANDISTDGISTFEDWWVHPELVDPAILAKMKLVDDKTKHVEKYMLSGEVETAVEKKTRKLTNTEVVNSVDWGTLTWDDIVTIKREIGNEDVYGYWRGVKTGDVVVDVGASVGPFVCTILQKQPSKVYCVEPSKVLSVPLQNNIAKYNDDKVPVEYINKAIVGNYDKVNIFGGSNNFETTSFMDFVADNKIDRINFLKVDCEGGEYSIFADENIDFLLNNVEYIAMETHLSYAGCREKFKQFRDKYLTRFKNYKVVSCTTQQIVWGANVDLKPLIFDDNFVDTYNCEFMIYIWNRKFDWGSNYPEYAEMFENEIFVNRVYEKYFTVNQGDVVVDFGANAGAFSYSIMDKNPSQVYCVEPSPTIISTLRKNMEGYPATIINKAISEVSFDEATVPSDGVFIHDNRHGTYSGISFKDFIKTNNISKIDFLKFDCEGGEYFIFTDENYDFIKNNVKRMTGEWHITHQDDAVAKFKRFRDTYLKNMPDFHIFDRNDVEVSHLIFDDSYIENFDAEHKHDFTGQLLIYIKNN